MPGGASPVWFMLRGEQKFGPYSHDKLKQLVDMGKVTPDDYFGCKGMERWTRGRHIPEVQALFDAKAAAPLTPPADTAPGQTFTFVVRVSDPGSGDISSTQVEASTAEQARRMVAATGMVVQGVQLKPPASPAPPPPSTFASAKANPVAASQVPPLLTDADRKRIADEEAFREQVRKRERNRFSMSRVLTMLVVLILVGFWLSTCRVPVVLVR